jgi:hypothetical protein
MPGDSTTAQSTGHEVLLVVTERPSARVTLKRCLPVSQARAVFLPRNPTSVRLNDGTWLLDDEVSVGLRCALNELPVVQGIVYVAEHSPTLLEVHAGLTAAENAQYYPPLPCDRSQDHYDATACQAASAWQPGPGHGPMCGKHEMDPCTGQVSCSLIDPYLQQRLSAVCGSNMQTKCAAFDPRQFPGMQP